MAWSGTALVTGAAKRIGRAIVLKLAAAGYDIAIHYHSELADAESTAEGVRQLGRRATTIRADLSSEQEMGSLVSRAASEMGPFSVLINNAAIFEPDFLGCLPRETWDSHFAVNLRAPIVLAQAFAAQAVSGSAIVNLIDQRVWRPTPDFFSYSLTKAALWFATRTMAQALAPHIRVNAVGPGPTIQSIHQTKEDFEAEAASILLERPVAQEQIADAVLYLATATSVTGQMIAVDGGQHLSG